MDSQKNVLKKGLKFIPKPKSLPIETLHTDIRNFMHRLKTIYELRTTNRPQKKYSYLPSYLRDSTEFLKLKETIKIPSNCLISSIDVSSLYTNIPHSGGKQSVLYYLQNNPDNYTRPKQPTPDVLVELIDIVLKMTYLNLTINITCKSKE